MADNSGPGLKRSLTTLDVLAFGITGIIGSGIFALPGFGAMFMGPASILALALGGVICFLIALCFAEVGSRYESTGAAYLYARDTLGEFVGFQVGWTTCLVSVTAWAALAVVFTDFLAYFIPEVGSGWVQKTVAIGILGGLTVINLFGVRLGALLNRLLTAAKLIPLLVVVVVGVFYIDVGNFEPWAPKGYGPLADTTLILLYAYVGFEVIAVPAGEMHNPQRNVPLALISVMLAVIVIYLLVMLVCIGVLPELAGNRNPVVSAAEAFMGSAGGTMVAVGICLSVFGTTAAMAVFGPRRLYALGERGDLPSIFAKVNPKTHVPTFTAIVFFIATAMFAATGSFKELVMLSVVARFAQFIPTAIAVLIFRARDRGEQKPGFRIPFGPVIPLVTIGLCVWLLVDALDKKFDLDDSRLLYDAIAVFIGVPLYFLARYNKNRATTT